MCVVSFYYDVSVYKRKLLNNLHDAFPKHDIDVQNIVLNAKKN